ncbi:MAG: BMP family ABC transporter substrate-binding protein [Oscillospiraceae bacterium]|nr:BMP family ABC transporter substrate-binding protein [Oscillospiraceae bacterium]
MAFPDYAKALKMGEKQYRQAVSRGAYPYLPVLEDLLRNSPEVSRVVIGRTEIPISLIAGTASEERTTAFASNFMPLLGSDTEFATKWSLLCDSVQEEGLRDPITVLEFMQRFYVIEGNKRVSVSKYFGAVTIDAVVTRVLPQLTDSTEHQLYTEFMEFYRETGLYEIEMSIVGGFPRLLAAIPSFDERTGKPCAWSDDLRHDVKFLYSVFEQHYFAKNGQRLPLVAGDAFLHLLEIYGYAAFDKLSSAEIRQKIDRVWTEFLVLAEAHPTSHILSPTDASHKASLTKILPLGGLVGSQVLKIAFLYPKDPQFSSWSYNHEIGRRYIEDVFGDAISISSYISTEDAAEVIIEQAIANGCRVIFTTSPIYHAVSMRMAVAHPDTIIINCSMNTAYRQLRTYYLRIYEAKFLAGIIAGEMTETNRIGYIADYPILGTPASINAFALGVKLVNPHAMVYLDWSTFENHDPVKFFHEKGIDIVSNRDIFAPDAQDTDFGLYGICDNISFRLAAPVWNWGRLYEELVHSVLIGAWKNDANENEKQALNYYWGISSGAIDLAYSTQLPSGTQRLVKLMKELMEKDRYQPFTGTLFSSDRRCIAEQDVTLTPDEIIHADWLCDNVKGRIPEASELNDACRSFVMQHGLKNGV